MAKNADLIMQYAIFAQEMDEPWLMFESRSIGTSSRETVVDLKMCCYKSIEVPQYSYFTRWVKCGGIPIFNSLFQQFRVIKNEKL